MEAQKWRLCLKGSCIYICITLEAGEPRLVSCDLCHLYTHRGVVSSEFWTSLIPTELKLPHALNVSIIYVVDNFLFEVVYALLPSALGLHRGCTRAAPGLLSLLDLRIHCIWVMGSYLVKLNESLALCLAASGSSCVDYATCVTILCVEYWYLINS